MKLKLLTAKDKKYENYSLKWYVGGLPSLPSKRLKFWAYSTRSLPHLY